MEGKGMSGDVMGNLLSLTHWWHFESISSWKKISYFHISGAYN